MNNSRNKKRTVVSAASASSRGRYSIKNKINLFLNHHYKLQNKFVLKSCQYLHRRISSPMMMLTGNNTYNDNQKKKNDGVGNSTTASSGGSSLSSSNSKFPPMESLVSCQGRGRCKRNTSDTSIKKLKETEDHQAMNKHRRQAPFIKDYSSNILQKKRIGNMVRPSHSRSSIHNDDDSDSLTALSSLSLSTKPGTIDNSSISTMGCFGGGATAAAAAGKNGTTNTNDNDTESSTSLLLEVSMAIVPPPSPPRRPPPPQESSTLASSSSSTLQGITTTTASPRPGDYEGSDDGTTTTSDTSSATTTVAASSSTTSQLSFPMIRWSSTYNLANEDGNATDNHHHYDHHQHHRNLPSSSSSSPTNNNADCIHSRLARRTKIYSKLNLFHQRLLPNFNTTKSNNHDDEDDDDDNAN